MLHNYQNQALLSLILLNIQPGVERVIGEKGSASDLAGLTHDLIIVGKILTTNSVNCLTYIVNAARR